MINKELEKYIKKNLKSQSLQDIKKDLINTGWRENDINDTLEELLNKKKIGIGKIILIIFLCLIIFGIIISGFLYYYLFIAPNLIPKPVIEKPALLLNNQNLTNDNNLTKNNNNITGNIDTNVTGRTNLGPEHIIFLLNEIGAYKLHNSPSGETPKIKFVLFDTKKDYFFSVIDNNLVEINETNPDVIITTDTEKIISVYNADNIQEEILDYYNEGFISLGVIADTTTLASKGYSALYDYFGITETGEAAMNNSIFKKNYFSIFIFLLLIILVFFITRLILVRKKIYKKHKKV